MWGFYLCTPWGENLPSSAICSVSHGISGQSGSEGKNESFGILAKCYMTYKTSPPCVPSSSLELRRGIQSAPCLCCIAAGCKARRTLTVGITLTLQQSLPSLGPQPPAAPLHVGLEAQGGTYFPNTSEHVKPKIDLNNADLKRASFNKCSMFY